MSTMGMLHAARMVITSVMHGKTSRRRPGYGKRGRRLGELRSEAARGGGRVYRVRQYDEQFSEIGIEQKSPARIYWERMMGDLKTRRQRECQALALACD